MLFSKDLKLIRCTEKEKSMVELIIERHCLSEAVYVLKNLILNGRVKWGVKGKNGVDTFELNDMCLNAVRAIKYNYKYLVVIENE